MVPETRELQNVNWREIDMWKFDRIVMVALALGIWALVLSPKDIGALALNEAQTTDGHTCTLSGGAHVEFPGASIQSIAVFKVKVDTSGLSVYCSHG